MGKRGQQKSLYIAEIYLLMRSYTMDILRSYVNLPVFVACILLYDSCRKCHDQLLLIVISWTASI